jgi:uncharacterized membrane protein YhaH (DUF805 family)
MFKGRIGIGQYWLSSVVLVLIVLGLAIGIGLAVAFAIPLVMGSGGGIGSLFLIPMIASGLSLIPAIIAVPYLWGLAVRRYHDIGLSAWFFVVSLILNAAAAFFLPVFTNPNDLGSISPVGTGVAAVLFVVQLAISLWPGTKGPNAYGEQTRYHTLWSAIRGKKAAL